MYNLKISLNFYLTLRTDDMITVIGQFQKTSILLCRKGLEFPGGPGGKGET